MGEVPTPTIYDKEETSTVLEDLKARLKRGDTTSPKRLRDGIIGDIENIMGWHDNFSPQTSLTDQQRVSELNQLKAAARPTDAQTISADIQKVVTWIDGRIEELKLTQANKFIESPTEIEQEKSDAVTMLLKRIEDEQNLFNAGIVRKEDSHPQMVGRENSTSDDEIRAHLPHLHEANRLKLELYDTLWS